jgi:hypothetical protein
MRDYYELHKKGVGFAEPCVIDECSFLSIIKMAKTRNKSLYKKLVAWYKQVNAGAIENKAKQPKGSLVSIPDILDNIGDF